MAIGLDLPSCELQKIYNSRSAQELGYWAKSLDKEDQYHDAVFGLVQKWSFKGNTETAIAFHFQTSKICAKNEQFFGHQARHFSIYRSLHHRNTLNLLNTV
jgi:hypothetical protein